MAVGVSLASLVHSNFFNGFFVNSYFHGRGNLAVA